MGSKAGSKFRAPTDDEIDLLKLAAEEDRKARHEHDLSLLLFPPRGAKQTDQAIWYRALNASLAEAITCLDHISKDDLLEGFSAELAKIRDVAEAFRHFHHNFALGQQEGKRRRGAPPKHQHLIREMRRQYANRVSPTSLAVLGVKVLKKRPPDQRALERSFLTQIKNGKKSAPKRKTPSD